METTRSLMRKVSGAGRVMQSSEGGDKMLKFDLTADEKPVEIFKERKSYMNKLMGKRREYSDCTVYELVWSVYVFERPAIKLGQDEGLNEIVRMVKQNGSGRH